ncbi:hypothetical protein [Parapedobacter sp. 2B3]|uniref:hypothetical protein n=1 Tax=Parapedobacter sp. 2B3 TaxID=3342381 RepID=UPI0035B61114
MGKAGWYIALSIILVLPAACRKGGCNVVPYVPVNRVQFSTAQYPALAGANGSITLSGGVAGIIVYNTGNGFVAYDRCSTVDPDKRCAVEVGSNPLVAIDPCSKAEFILLNGSPAKLAECPLRPYAIQQVGSGAAAIYYIDN